MSYNIVLIGFMGAGKTLIAKHLAIRLKRAVFSTDSQIVEREQRSIADIFRDSGESYFRQVEKVVVQEAAQQHDAVIDCGGGIVLDPENIRALKKTGVLFYLSATPREIYQRIKDQTHRPLLHVPDPLRRIEDLLKERACFYAQADHVIATEGQSPQKVCQEIIDIMNL